MQNSNPADSHMKGLGGRTAGGGVATLITQVTSTVIGMIGLAFLARILLPEDFGLVAKVTALTGLVGLIGDIGLSLATIQSKSLSEREISALFWVNVAVAAFVAALMAATGPLIAAFYGDPDVLVVVLLLAPNVLFAGLGVQHQSVLARNLQFEKIAVITILATALSTLLAVLAATHLSMGYKSLLIQLILRSGFRTLGFWMISNWIPRWEWSISEIRQQLAIGGHFTLSRFINYFSRNFDNVLIGKVWGEQAVGYYAKAYGLLLLPLNQLAAPMTQVAVPALSKLQDDPERYRAFFRRGVSIALLLQVPISVFAAVAGSEIVLTVLGPQWAPATAIFYALIPNLLASATSPATHWVFTSMGDTRRMVKATLVNSTIISVGFAIAVPFGALAVAISYSITSVAVRIPTILYCFKGSPLRPSDFFPTLIVPTVCSSVAAAVCLVVFSQVAEMSPPLALVLKTLIFGVVYVAAIGTTKTGRSTTAFFRELMAPKFRRLLAGASR